MIRDDDSTSMRFRPARSLAAKAVRTGARTTLAPTPAARGARRPQDARLADTTVIARVMALDAHGLVIECMRRHLRVSGLDAQAMRQRLIEHLIDA